MWYSVVVGFREKQARVRSIRDLHTLRDWGDCRQWVRSIESHPCRSEQLGSCLETFGVLLKVKSFDRLFTSDLRRMFGIRCL